MKRVLVAVGLLAVSALVIARVEAQQAMVRGTIVDPEGQPVAGANVEIECMQDNRPKKFKLTTDKKGGYIRVGLPGGKCTVNVSKEGYAGGGVDIHISLGGLSEIPPIVMKPRPAGAAAPAAASAPATAPPPATAAPAAPPDIQSKLLETFGKAVEAAKADRLEEAEGLYKEILVTAPNTPEVHHNLGTIYRRRKDWAAAEASFRKAIELQPDRSDGYTALAAMLEASGAPEKGLAVLTEAAPKFEQDGRFHFQLAIAYTNAGRAQEATAAFRKAASLDPANAEILFYLGTAAVGRNDVAEAIANLEKYVAATGQNPQNLATAQQLLKALRARK